MGWGHHYIYLDFYIDNEGNKMNEALIIIDMQEGCFKTPRYDREGIVFRINSLSKQFRKQQKPVIFVQHNGIKENYLLPNTNDFNIIKDLVKEDQDYVVEKLVNDAFYKTNLEELLSRIKVDTIYITGLATDFCVNATVHSALVKDFNIIIVSDCHTTADKPKIKARDIIEFHNLIWENLTPTDGKITVKKHNEIVTV
jgi:nicotinamidase-related amidase